MPTPFCFSRYGNAKYVRHVGFGHRSVSMKVKRGGAEQSKELQHKTRVLRDRVMVRDGLLAVRFGDPQGGSEERSTKTDVCGYGNWGAPVWFIEQVTGFCHAGRVLS